MAPPSGLQHSAISSDSLEAPFPALARSSTLPTTFQQARRPDPSHLAPEDAFYAASPPRRLSAFDNGDNGSGTEMRSRRLRHKIDGESRSRSRRRKRTWKKLLWVKQSYPDNYTDQATFLENLQRNPRLQPYDFWPLVADSTVIVQHVCSVIIFVVCFVGIFQERLSPVSVVGWGSFATLIGWLLWDWWVGKESEEDDGSGLARTKSIGRREFRPRRHRDETGNGAGSNPNGLHGDESHTTLLTTSNSSVSNLPSAASSTSNLHTTPSQQDMTSLRPQYPPSSNPSSSNLLTTKHLHSVSASSLASATSQTSATGGGIGRGSISVAPDSGPKHRPSSPLRGGRAHLRASTVKSAILIYFTLLGLSPILKSLTRSTSSDSIWAMSFWLLTINIFFFDYSGAWVGVNKFPVASLSTNAALMASTVLASRLPSTGQVFSLTLFSIEVFGLFPVFRRYARHRSWRYHMILTVLLVLGAGGGVGMILGRDESGEAFPWKGGLAGMVIGCIIVAVAMGGCSWWLIGLQKYKNEIYGPWDPARPIIISRRHWDDE